MIHVITSSGDKGDPQPKAVIVNVFPCQKTADNYVQLMNQMILSGDWVKAKVITLGKPFALD